MKRYSFWSFTHKYDFFSQHFNFMMGEKIKRSTIFGGLLSLTIMLISISYFSYLLYNFFGYRIYPNVSNSITVNDMIDLELDYDFQMFQILINGQSILDYEKQMNKKYVKYKLLFEEFTDSSQKQIDIELEFCDHPDFLMFYCIKKDKSFEKLYLDSKKRYNGTYSLLIGKCINEIGVQDNCADEQEIDDLLSDINSFFQYYIKIKQYNTLSRKFEVGFKSEFKTFDASQVLITNINMKKATSQVTDGLIIQSTEKEDTVFEYVRVDSSYDKDSYQYYDSPGFKLAIQLAFNVDQISNYVIIQHIPLTQVLAQFMSAFNSLLLIGIFARKFANKNIQSDIISILLADQYKQEAFNIVQQSQQKKVKDKKNRISFQVNESKSGQQQINKQNVKGLKDKVNQYQTKDKTNQKTQSGDQIQSEIVQKIELVGNQNNDQKQIKQKQIIKSNQQQQSLKIQPQEQKQERLEKKEDLFETICKKHEVLQNEDLNQSISQIMNITTFQKMKQIFFKKFCKKRINQSDDDLYNHYSQTLKNIEEEMKNSLNIYSIFQELIYLKRAIKIILSEDQYAALHYCTTQIIQDPQNHLIKQQEIINQQQLFNENKQNQEQELKKIIQDDLLSPIQSRDFQNDLEKLNYQQQFLSPHITSKNQIINFNNAISNQESLICMTPNTNSHRSQSISKQKRFISSLKNNDSKNIQESENEKQSNDNQNIVNNLNLIGDREGLFLHESLTDLEIKEDNNDDIRKNFEVLNDKIPKILLSCYQSQNLQNQGNHLVKMDIIDKNLDMRTQLLNQFINKMYNQQNNNLSSIDTNIFNSLFK